MAEAPAIGIDLGTTYRYIRSCSRGAVREAATTQNENASQPGQLHAGTGRMRSCRPHKQLLGDCFSLEHACLGISALQGKEATIDAQWKRPDDQ